MKILADNDLIVGRGSRTHLKCCILLDHAATPSIADGVIERGLRAAAVHGRLVNSQASQTCIADRWSNHIGTVTVYRQVRGWAFGQRERQRQDRADAERRQLAVA